MYRRGNQSVQTNSLFAHLYKFTLLCLPPPPTPPTPKSCITLFFSAWPEYPKMGQGNPGLVQNMNSDVKG